jgi:hypothetical protein
MNATNVTERFDSVDSQLAQKANQSNIMLDKKSLIRNSDFETMPYIQSRSSVYTFTAGITSPQYGNKKSLKIESVNYTDSTDTNKDFSFVLTEKMMTGEKLKVSFKAYPSVSNKTIFMRMAYMSGTAVNLGMANQWNDIEFTLDLTTMSTANSNFYVDFTSSFTLYISDLKIMNTTDIIETDLPLSFTEVNEKQNESPSLIHNSDGIIDRLISNAQTYLDNVNLFSYGNSNTAYDATVTPTNGLYQIDCSSFANLMIHGVPFANSRYNGNTTNIISNLFFQNIDPTKYRLANQMAKYAYDKGYAFKPNADLSNIEPGDVLFFSWNNYTGGGDTTAESRQNAFMQIDHVAVVLNKKNESYWQTLQFDNGISTVYYTATNSYMSQCVLVARFPYANVESMYSNDNLLIDGDTAKAAVSTSTLGAYNLAKPLEKGKYYTIYINGQITTADCYFVIQTGTFTTIYSDLGKVGSYNGITRISFPYLLDEVTTTLRVAIGNSNVADTSKNGNITWTSLYQGYKRNKQTYIKNYNTLTAWTKPTFLNSWVENASHPVSYRKAGDGKVYLRGAVSGGTSGSIAFQLPTGYRPTQFMAFPSVNLGATASSRVTLDTNGNVTITGDTTFVELNHVSFFID